MPEIGWLVFLGFLIDTPAVYLIGAVMWGGCIQPLLTPGAVAQSRGCYMCSNVQIRHFDKGQVANWCISLTLWYLTLPIYYFMLDWDFGNKSVHFSIPLLLLRVRLISLHFLFLTCPTLLGSESSAIANSSLKLNTILYINANDWSTCQQEIY